MTRVLVLAGGLSPERDVSLRSGRRLAQALKDSGFDVSVRDVDATLVDALAADRPDVVVPLVHGSAGEDGALRDVLEVLGLPYVGSRPGPSRLAFDKPAAREVLTRAGAAVPAGVALPHAVFRDLGAGPLLSAVIEHLGLPVVVKPARGGSALGVTVVEASEALPSAMVGAFAYDETVLIEAFIAGTELAISVIDLGDGPIALPAVEIEPVRGRYDYAARYTAGDVEFFAPARLDADVAARAAELAVAAHKSLGLEDWSRTDIIVDEYGVPWFLEATVAPGMTETSLLPQAAGAAGYDVGELMGKLVARAELRGSRL
jgi:D-alanine-D-alanine ligase